jgi:GntR family transcriptional repressor for pyruvate dehydrogenase complex
MTNPARDFNDQFRGTLRREAVSEQITERILSMIREQQLKPGDKLPAERELAVLMQVSRATVREALRSLAMMNVVELRHGSGTYITSLKPQLLVQNFDLVFSLNDNAYFELIETRKVIEPGVAALTARNITDDEVAELADVMVRSRQCVHDNPASFPNLDIEFHNKIAEFSHNALVTRIMQALSELSIASSQRTALSPAGELSLEGIHRAIEMHQGIFEAIQAHKPGLAHEQMYHHLVHVEKTLHELVQQDR